MSDILCRYAKEEDIVALYELSYPYHSESMYGALFGVDRDTAIDTFTTAVRHPEIKTFVTEQDGKLTGIACVVQSSSFFNGYEGDVDFFYITPESRANGTARMLVEACVDYADHNPKLNALHCGCHSNMNDGGKNDALYTNLFKKYGFEVTGTNLFYLPKHKKG